MLRCLPMQAGRGSATLSMAYAAAKFAESCVLALQGQPVVECAYVESHLTDLPFFASQVRLGPSGVEVRCSWPTQSGCGTEVCKVHSCGCSVEGKKTLIRIR